MTDPHYEACLNCGGPTPAGAYSATHARTMDQVQFHSTFAWCFNCGLVTVSTKPFLARLLRAGEFKRRGTLSMDVLAIHHDRFKSGEPNYSEMLWCMRLCFLTREGVNPGRTSASDEDSAWQVAKSSVGPLHLAGYCHVVLNQHKIPESTAAEWFRQIETEFASQMDYRIRQHIKSDRERHEAATK